MVCTDDRLKILRTLGYKTNGYSTELEEIIKNLGFNLPTQGVDDYNEIRFGFRHKGYLAEYLNYADALAEELIFIYEHKLIER